MAEGTYPYSLLNVREMYSHSSVGNFSAIPENALEISATVFSEPELIDRSNCVSRSIGVRSPHTSVHCSGAFNADPLCNDVSTSSHFFAVDRADSIRSITFPFKYLSMACA